MEITTITKYKTKDGRVFTDKTRAEEHEKRLENKTVHYIIDFAHLVVHKAYYLEVKETLYAGHKEPTRMYRYETESGTVISDETIHECSYIIIMSEDAYKVAASLILKMFEERRSYEEFYASSKFTNPLPKKLKNTTKVKRGCE